MTNEKSSCYRKKTRKVIWNEWGESKYYRHTGILNETRWQEVPKGTKKGFFAGAVLSEADINFSTELFYINDISTVLNSLIQIGAVVITVIVGAKMTPVVLTNLQALSYYVKTFGVLQGFEMYCYLGVQNLPNGIITLIQADLADGDTIADDIIYYVNADAADGDTPLDDMVLGTYNNLRKIYKGTGIECHH